MNYFPKINIKKYIYVQNKNSAKNSLYILSVYVFNSVNVVLTPIFKVCIPWDKRWSAFIPVLRRPSVRNPQALLQTGKDMPDRMSSGLWDNLLILPLILDFLCVWCMHRKLEYHPIGSYDRAPGIHRSQCILLHCFKETSSTSLTLFLHLLEIFSHDRVQNRVSIS